MRKATMNRREFLRRSAAAVGAVALAPLMPMAAAPVRECISVRYIKHFDVTGLRYIKHFDVTGHVTRYDVLYGFGAVSPELGARIEA